MTNGSAVDFECKSRLVGLWGAMVHANSFRATHAGRKQALKVGEPQASSGRKRKRKQGIISRVVYLGRRDG
jgi:hypothetical protein